jgi:hypothetical protein
MTLAYPDWFPTDTTPGQLPPLTNLLVLEHARHFLEYAQARGNRGTPH